MAFADAPRWLGTRQSSPTPRAEEGRIAPCQGAERAPDADAGVVSPAPAAPKNSHLGAAKAAKNDEFYTQWADIEREMNAYLEYDPDVFRDKVILLPCDDPEWSNFTKFFALHFVDFGLKKLISTSYAPDSNPAKVNYQPTLFETESPAFDATKTRANGKKFVLEAKDINGDGVINIDDLQWEYLEGDGDFRSRRGDGAARRGRHRHHQPAVQPVPPVRDVAGRGRTRSSR